MAGADKVLLDSIVAQAADGSLVVGRVPAFVVNAATSAGATDEPTGTITLPAGARRVVVTLGRVPTMIA
jgi:hypothetical protein